MAQSGYDMYFDKCLFPVTPEKISIKINGNNKTVNLINEGEINILKKTGLTDIEFEAEIPQVKHPYAVYKNGFKEAGYFFDIFEGLKTGKKTFQFIVCRKTPVGKKLLNTNMKVSLEDYKISEDAKNGFDFKVKFNLKQYRDYGTKTVNIKIAASKPKASAEPKRETNNSPAPAAAQTYTVVRGDCLWNIAKRFYGSGAKYTVIYNANRGVIGGNPNLIYPGQVLKITPGAGGAADTTVRYTVRRGDTLWAISRRFNTTVSAIANLNGIRNPNLIYPGQVLTISA